MFILSDSEPGKSCMSDTEETDQKLSRRERLVMDSDAFELRLYYDINS